ncbi:MAG: hypothetical protein ACRDDZ_10075 [Marinifilaceae bacterium]
MKAKQWNKWMRSTHRYVGFFMVGVMFVYALSGILLFYRNTDFLKDEITTVQVLEQSLNAEDVGKALKIRGIKVIEETDNIIVFAGGSYNKQTGESTYTRKEVKAPFNKMITFHKMTSQNPMHYVGIFSGIGLLLLVITSFWMFQPQSKFFKRGMVIAIIGVIITVIAVGLI